MKTYNIYKDEVINMSEPILKVENMNKRFGSTVALKMCHFLYIRGKFGD